MNCAADHSHLHRVEVNAHAENHLVLLSRAQREVQADEALFLPDDRTHQLPAGAPADKHLFNPTAERFPCLAWWGGVREARARGTSTASAVGGACMGLRLRRRSRCVALRSAPLSQPCGTGRGVRCWSARLHPQRGRQRRRCLPAVCCREISPS